MRRPRPGQRLSHDLGVGDDLVLIVAKRRLASLKTALAAMTCISGPPCRPGKWPGLIRPSRARPSSGWCRHGPRAVPCSSGQGNDVGEGRNKVRMKPAAIRDRRSAPCRPRRWRRPPWRPWRSARSRWFSRVGRCAGDDQARLVFAGERFHAVVVDFLIANRDRRRRR